MRWGCWYLVGSIVCLPILFAFRTFRKQRYFQSAYYQGQVDELVDWLGVSVNAAEVNSDTVQILIPAFPRRLIHKYNLLHRGIGALLLTKSNDEFLVFVHKRTSTKRIFPSMKDMFIGGVSCSGESSFQTLERELYEECGIKPILPSPPGIGMQALLSDFHASKLRSPCFIGETVVKTNYNHCLVSCFLVFLDQQQASTIQFQDGEIESGEWLSVSSLEDYLNEQGDEEFVPDGMQVLT